MFQNNQKVVVVSSGDERRVIKVQSASGTPDPSRYPIVDTTGVSGRDQSVQIVSGGDPTRFPILRGVSDARATADSVITALTPAAWYRNATGVTSAGGFASQWDDYSGNGRHLVQATGTNQPAYAAGVLTGDGVDNWMRATFALAQPIHIFAVARQDSWTINSCLYDGTTVNTGAVKQTIATPNVGFYAGTAYTQADPDPAVGAWAIISTLGNGASSLIRINDNAAVVGDSGSAAMGGLTIFDNGDTASQPSNVSFKEIVVFASALSETDQDAVITALNNALTVF